MDSPNDAAACKATSSSAWSWQTKTPFPAARPSALITHGGRAIDSDSRSRNACRLHHVLRERLRALDPGGSGARPEDGHADMPELICDAGDERRLRPDDDEVCFE